MSPKERINKLFRKEPIDTMPVFSGQGMVTIQAVEEIGIPFSKVHTSAEYLAESAIKSAELFDFDAVIIPYDLCTIPESLGRGVSFYDDSEEILYPTVPNKWDNFEDIKIPGDFLTKGRMPIVDEALKILKEKSETGRFAVGAHVLGPFTMAGQLFELDLLLKGAKKQKEKVGSFLSNMTDLVITVARHYQELGVDYINIREMGSGSDIISPRMFKTLVLPNLHKVFAALEFPAVLHICGSTDLIIEMMNDCGADAISIDNKTSITETRKKLGDDVLLFGDFNAYTTLVEMNVSEVEPVIKECIDNGYDAVWPGCDLWPEVKKENVNAYVNTIHKFGKKPSPAVGRLKE
jgi:[methyl-Co(III) methanol-specific corrinoid protein]:coenzyme M methyltransferase